MKHVLGGRTFISVTESTVEHDLYFHGLAGRAGLRFEKHDDENAEDFAARVLEMTAGDGVHVVYDGVGQATFTGSLKALRRRGTLALFGGASGAVKSVNPLDLAEAGSVFLTRPHLWDYTATAEEIDRRAGDLFKWVAEGRLKVAIDREFPLGMAKAAHDVLESRQSKGKIILNVEEAA